MVEANSSMIGETVEKAVLALILRPKLYKAMEWPVADADLESAGLYAWYVDRHGAAELSKGLGHEVDAGLIYVGQTGATIGSKRLARTLGERIGKDHIYGRVRSSTFRLTLASCLLDVCPLQCIGPRSWPQHRSKRCLIGYAEISPLRFTPLTTGTVSNV
jgi:hypothetical protein